MTSKDPFTITPGTNPRWNWLFKLGSLAAFILLILFLIGMIAVSTTGLSPNAPSGWLASFPNNWLMVLFRQNTAWVEAQSDVLNVLNPLDIAIMALCGLVFLSLYAALRRTSKVWSIIAAALPFLGIVVFLFTHTAGRSGLLIGGLIFSAVMLRSSIFSKASAYTGLAASILLFFAGDIGTALFSSSGVIAVLIGVGYVLWMVWFFLLGRRLLQLSGDPSQAK